VFVEDNDICKRLYKLYKKQPKNSIIYEPQKIIIGFEIKEYNSALKF
jgi:hypothetical protein